MTAPPTPADWDARYRGGDTPWDLGEPSSVVMRLVSAHLAPTQRVVVPGCGLGRHVEEIASLGHRVTGLDIAPTAVQLTSDRLRAAGVSNATIVLGDFLAPASPLQGDFDVLVEHTCYCALAPTQWPTYVAAATRLLKPGGLLIGAFLEFEGGGPPFGTSMAAVRRQFGAAFEIIHLSRAPELFAAKGVPQLEAVFRRRPPR